VLQNVGRLGGYLRTPYPFRGLAAARRLGGCGVAEGVAEGSRRASARHRFVHKVGILPGSLFALVAAP